MVDMGVAQTAYTTAHSMGASDKVILALMEAGLVESGMRNLSYGDRDSVGFLQQRASWGTKEQRMNVAYATTKFVEKAKRLEGKYTSAGSLAQAVQVSAFPLRYAAREAEAKALIAKLQGGILPVAVTAPASNDAGAAPVITRDKVKRFATGIVGAVLIVAGLSGVVRRALARSVDVVEELL